MGEAANTSVIWDVPHERNENFVGRDGLLSEVRQRMVAGDRLQVLHGLGGIGKTQTAVEFAYRHRDDYSLVWWVPAVSESSILLAYEKLADRLGHRLSPKTPEAVAVEILNGLLAERRALLVFDGAVDVAAVRPLLPTVATCHVLITSRSGNWEHVAHTRPMRVLSRADSVAFLRRRTGLRDTAEIDRVAQTLGDLPLALEQAAAVIKKSGGSFADYLRRFETQWAQMLGEGLRPVDYPRSVAMTWSLAFDAVEASAPAAADLLNFATFLNSDLVPLQLLRDGAEYLPPSLAALAHDPRLWEAALSALLSYSLVEADERLGFGMHRLVAMVTRDRMSGSAKANWCAAAVGLLGGLFRFDSGDLSTWRPCGQLLPHVLEATAHAEGLNVVPSQTVHLLNDAGRYLLKRAQYTDAKQVLERAMELCSRTVGETHPKLSAIANNLGRVHDHLGDVDRAIEFFGQAIAIDTAAYGETHPHVAEVINNYGICMQKKGDREMARRQFKWAAEIYEAHYGPEHPKLAQILNNLGYTLKSDNAPEALEQLQRALIIAEVTVGPNHPTTARILFNLSDVYRTAGNLPAARQVLERALAIDEAALGSSHPETVSDCAALAAVLAESQEPARAAEYRDRAVRARQLNDAARNRPQLAPVAATEQLMM